MKGLFFDLILTTCFLGNITILDAQWIQTNGPYSGDITSFAVDDTIIFAGANNGGVYRSTNDGANWTAVETGLMNTKINALAVDGGNLFMGTIGNYNAGIFLSTDNGENWILANSGLTNPDIYAIVIDSTNIFVGTANGLFLSTNNGNLWFPVMTNATITALAIDDTSIFAGTDNGIFRSSNHGNSWTEADSGVKQYIVNAFAKLGTNLFAGITIPHAIPVGSPITSDGGVYISKNNGTSWVEADSGLPGTPVNSLVVKDGNIFAGTPYGVYRSSNNGSSWTSMNSGLTNNIVNTFVVKGTNLYTGTLGGVFISKGSDTTWTSENSGIINISISALAVFDSNLFAGDSGILLSTDGGTSWTKVFSGVSYISAFAKSGTDLFASMQFSPGFLRSTDNGRNWSLLDTESTNDYYFTCLAVSGTNIFAGDGQTGQGVFLSTDNGTTWTPKDSGLTNKWVYSLAVSPSGNGVTNIYAGTQNGGVFLSTNNGKSWTLPSTDLSNEIVFSLVTMGTELFAGTNNGVYLSTNNGRNWSHVGPQYAYVTSLVVSGSNLFAGGTYTAYSDGGVFLTTDNGSNWTAVDSGLTNTDIDALAIGGTNLFAGTYGSGTWVRPLSEMITGVKNKGQNNPTSFSLSQNYPNPFNPSTVISYQLPLRSYVTLKIYDILGREVATLVNEVKNAGSYSITFNASNLATGIYFYRLQAGSFVQVRKMILLK